jgi:predicted transposase YbfD/YdcC
MNKHQPSNLPDLRSIFSTLPDGRINRTQYHKLEDILVIATCAMLCGQEHFTLMETFGKKRREWLAGFLELPHGIPSHDTFRNVFAALDPALFLEAFGRWTEGVLERLRASGLGGKIEGVVAIDGKALRGALDAGEQPRVIVGAWAAQLGLCLGQVKVNEKSNEITALPELLDLLALEGCIVTIDAMGCQREVAAKIIARGGDYVLALKGNQGNLHEQTRCYLDEAYELARALGHYHEEKSTGHGRREIRRCWAMDELGDWLHGVEKWKDLRSVAVVEREWTEKGVTRVERRYYITSLEPDAEVIGRAVRSHWGIENSVHWVLDVAFREDESRVRTGHAPENLSALRRWVCAMIKRDDPASKTSINQKRFEAALDPAYLARILGVMLDA